ncbi:hypothetical protein UFOVP144_18 [uncultured Caudovirales phage]|uniref:Uncharacterized protein n=1 Tax=uncultured Caudovirales phage TaxID=2100421 RepID=A0A6J7XLI9_9CAUD|nr:hypothetical protein UFOVP144_18 [uncultured Caudovirales phage]
MTQALDDMIAFINSVSSRIHDQQILITELERKLKQYETKYGELPNE